jgi:hypothetical protein
MMPKKTVREVWMGKYAILDLDIFQHRENLKGFCYASLMAKDPRNFLRMLEKQVDES